MPDVRAHRVLSSLSRVAVLETLRESGGPLGVRELAERMSLHKNTVRKHLDLLVENGFATRLRDGAVRRGRPRFVYAALPSPTETQLHSYRLLASVFAAYLHDADDPQAAAEEAGRRFGARSVDGAAAGLSAVDGVVRMLDDIGFRPELGGGGSEIRLRHCPFHELTRDRQDVVCGIHLGLIRGSLQRLGAAEQEVRLLPFVTPTLCMVRIGPRPPG
jgi:predicted ArsR family transcriptional regulator